MESFGTDALDAEWKRLADRNDTAHSIEAQYEHYIEMAEQKLAELRDLARMSLTEQRIKKGK